MRRWIAPMLIAVAVFAAVPPAQAAHSRDTFLLMAEEENVGTAANGDHVAVTVDEGAWFDASPKSVSATGEFTHFDADGNVRGAGTWTATSLISFDFYGCRFIPSLGIDLGDDNLCGGAVKMAVMLDTPIGQFPGILTVFCVVGPQAPASHRPPAGEGVKPDSETAHDTHAAASSTKTKLYGNGKTAGEIAIRGGARPSTVLHGPGNSQPHKAAPCSGGHEIDVHALKSRRHGTGCGSVGGPTGSVGGGEEHKNSDPGHSSDPS